MKTIFKSLLFSIFIFLLSCGVKGSPKIPPSNTPEPVKNIKIKQQGNTFVVYWKYIPVYEDNRKMHEDFSFEVEENDKTIKPNIKNYRDLYWFRRDIDSFDTEYCYRIKVITKRSNSSISRYYCFLPSIDFPINNVSFSLEIKNEGILLTFDKNYEHLFIYKGEDENTIPPLVYKSLKRKTELLDTNTKLNKRYCYYFTVFKDNIESNPSKIKCILYKDIFPPKPVKNPEIIKHKEKLFIIWTESPSKDVIGYIIEKNGKLLNKEPIYGYFFILDSYKKGDTIAIYAVDKAGNKSPPVYLKVE